MFRVCNSLAFLLALLAAVTAFGMLQFLATHRSTAALDNGGRLHAWAAQLCVHLPYRALWVMFLGSLSFMSLGLGFVSLYVCGFAFAITTLVVLAIAAVVGLRIMTMFWFFSTAVSASDLFDHGSAATGPSGARTQWHWCFWGCS
jgi:hypothetical protein